MARFVWRRGVVVGLAALLALAGLAPALVSGRSVLAASYNPIPNENAQPGTSDWEIGYDQIAQHREIEGYASASSVNRGGSINFMVSVTKAQAYTIKVFRMGYYGGAGGRLMTTIGPLSGSYQGLPAAGPAPTYLIEAHWPVAYTLQVPTTWVSGYYLAKLIRNDGFARYIIFVVRNDSDPAPIVMTAAMTTYQAYNDWGGFSLYGKFNYNYTSPSFGQSITGPMASEVSFDRPYDNIDELDGAGQFFNWEDSMVRYLEREGRWVTYISDVDLQNSSILSLPGRNTFLSVGHDEYWSGEARATVTNARQAGMNLLWLSGNQVWWKIRFGSDSAGNANRNIFCYKSGGDPLTGYWSAFLPENELIGSTTGGSNWQSPSNYVVTSSGAYSWIYNNSGLTAGSSIQGLVGKEYDVTEPSNGYQPAGLQIIAHSPTSDGGVSDAIAYTASSGALVINMGTFQWVWGLDSYSSAWSVKIQDNVPTSAAAIKVTDNILDRFTGVSGPAPTPPGTPAGVTASAGNASATVSWTAPGSGGSPITGYRITTTGTGAPAPIVYNSTATSETVTGLTNGNSYTFTVAAINAIGTGSDSSSSNAVVPATLPAAPTGATATAGVGSATVSWTAPSDNGGSPITGYRVTTIGTGAPSPVTFNSTATSQTISSLPAGNSYSFTVAAINALGTGPDSSASNSVIPTASVPGMPTNVTATAGNAIATVTWTGPANNGGSSLIGYRVTTIGTGAPAPIVFNSTATTQSVTGLTNGNSYTFTVAAINGVGTGPDSAASNAVTPTAVVGTSLVQGQTFAFNLATTASGAYSQPVSTGDTLVALVAYPGAWGNTVSSMTDSLGNTWTRAVGTGASDACGDDGEIWTSRATSTGNDTVTVVLSAAAGSWVNWNFTLSEFKGGAAIGNSGADNSNSTTHTATATGASAGDYAVAMYVNCGYNTTISASAGWTVLGSNTANTSYQTESDQVYELNLAAGTTSVTFTNGSAAPAEVLVLNLTPKG